MCAQTSSTMGGGILQNLSLKGSSSTTLILCFARPVQPSSPSSEEKMSWYSANRVWVAAWFLLDHPCWSDRSSYQKSTFLLCSTDILVCWISYTSSSFSKVLGATSTWDTAFAAISLSDFNTLGNSDQNGHQIFHYDCSSLAPSSHFSVSIHNTQAMRQVGSITPLKGLHHYMHVVLQEHGFCSAMYDLYEKASISSFFVGLTASFKSVRSTVWLAAASPLMESSTQWHANEQDILDPFMEADNSSISYSLIMLMIQLIVSVPSVTGTQDPKMVESVMIRATWSLL